ncbi:GTP-binding protein Obg/CgtA [Patellaria atrata CBS 101060]|uniref:GTP-binding protein Obg/CgtA n=1 Tax=Patellaria atrata CBS 101060 TaxID=1346257 RepID=A0A9P4SD65_9PEZI|nr:GTP-binding protein Obg/CgtA [Patellaria atrata CBS 101060]
MSSVRVHFLRDTLTPFLYPTLLEQSAIGSRIASRYQFKASRARRCNSTTTLADSIPSRPGIHHTFTANTAESHLNPSPDSYSLTPFTDRCTLLLQAGAGGHGCVSFVREKYIEQGPANGGDGGSGGSIYIQAVRGETSLHRLARRGQVKAERGKNGQGKGQGGERGNDLILSVPVGTVVRELWRHDPIAEEEERQRKERMTQDPNQESTGKEFRGDKWLLYPGAMPKSFTPDDLPQLPRARRSHLIAVQPQAPIRLDLDTPMERPMLLAAGAMGGLGNPNFVTKERPNPKYATRGEEGIKLTLQLELKILADVGLVGLPNAGKSTLLRALTNSRARVGNWAFTTLQPNIGTVVLDNFKGRPKLKAARRSGEPRTNFTIADIPGLIEGAHEDRGLGLGFLRHIERAAVLAFVVDLSAGDAVKALKGLWTEVSEYERLRGEEVNAETEARTTWQPLELQEAAAAAAKKDSDALGFYPMDSDLPELPPLTMPPISSKPWLVIATKADLPDTQENFLKLQEYLSAVRDGTDEHPSGKKNAWRSDVQALPISAIRAEGVDRIPEMVVSLLND